MLSGKLWGEKNVLSPAYEEREGKFMYTVSDILMDIQRGIAAHNMVETEFSYRLVYFINFGNRGEKHYLDTHYDDLRITLENIIRGNLTTTNTIVLATVTVLKNGEAISLLSRAYAFSLDEYFQQIVGEKEKKYKSTNYGRRRANWG
ncbi:MAG: hypothetical protein J1E98_11825 [Lachnospiraceae bacterium]|nr:hypothetical protein [Lachnospiraceae bacterium]